MMFGNDRQFSSRKHGPPLCWPTQLYTCWKVWQTVSLQLSVHPYVSPVTFCSNKLVHIPYYIKEITMRILLVILVLITADIQRWIFVNGHKCERITVPICSELGYNLTVMPNFVGHEDQTTAEREVCHVFLKI